MGFFLGGALVSSAPTAQKCIVYFVGAAETAAPPGSAPTAQKCTIYFVGAAETAAPPGRTNRASTAPTELTIRGYVEVRGGCVKTQLTRAESPTTTFLVLPDSNRFFLCLLVKVLFNHWFWGCVKTRYGCIYLRYSASFATARARCDMPFLMSMPSCANDSS